MPIFIKEINESHLNYFIDFPYKLFKKNPYWVGDLKSNVKKTLSLSNPFWFHCERKLFLAENEKGEILGRIAAIINRNHNSFHEEQCGFFGFFDCIDNAEVSKLLFARAEEYLKEKGMDIMRGPANPSSNDIWGMLIEGFDSQNMVMMPYNPSYYVDLTENYGFKKEKDLYAFKFLTVNGFPERFEKIVNRSLKAGNIKIEKADIKNINKVITDFKDVYNQAWEKNWGFVPMTEQEIDYMADELKDLIKPDYLFFIKVDDKVAGCCLMFPDFNIALKAANGSLNPLNIFPFLWKFLFGLNRGRLLALGVKNEYRNRGLELVLIREAIKNALKLGWEFGELSWTLEDNHKINTIIKDIGGILYKKYRIYSKKIKS